MKTLLLTISLLSIINFNHAQQQESNIMKNEKDNRWILNDLITKWENNKAYTLKVFKAMPEEHYDFKPTSGIMSFKEQATHFLEGFNFQLKAANKNNLPAVTNDSKKDLIKSSEKIFDALIEMLKNTKASNLNNTIKMWYGDSSLLRIYNLLDNHLAHHRGQMVVYLRINNIKAPTYVGW